MGTCGDLARVSKGLVPYIQTRGVRWYFGCNEVTGKVVHLTTVTPEKGGVPRDPKNAVLGGI